MNSLKRLLILSSETPTEGVPFVVLLPETPDEFLRHIDILNCASSNDWNDKNFWSLIIGLFMLKIFYRLDQSKKHI